MAENKKSFLLYANIIHTVKKLSKEQVADLFLTILEYVNDNNPVVNDIAVDLVFEPIKQQLKIDLKKWDEKIAKYSSAGRSGGLKSGEARRSNASKIEAKRSDASTGEANEAVIDNVIVNVNDNVNNDVIKDSFPKIENEIQYTIEHCLTVALNDNRWVQANKATRSDLEAFNKKLEGRGIYQKNPADYKTHFHNWKAGGMKDKDIPEVSKVIANRDQKAKNFLNSIN